MLETAISTVPTVIEKAAEQFCKRKGYIFKYSDIPKITDREFQKLYKEGEVKLLERYEQKYKEKYEAPE